MCNSRRLILLSIMTLVSACATVSKPIEQLQVTPADRIAWIDYEKENAAKVLFARDKGFTGSAARAIVELNGERVGIVYNNEVMEISIKPGTHVATITIQTPFGENLFRPRSLSFESSEKSEIIIRIGFDDGNRGVSVWLASE